MASDPLNGNNALNIDAKDTLEIAELHSRYYLCTDDKDVRGFMDCWVDDGFEGFFGPFGDFVDRESLEKFEYEHVNGGPAEGKRHFVDKLTLKQGFESGTVFATSYMTVVEVQGPPRIVATGLYRDSVVRRTRSGFKFVRRELVLDPGFDALQSEASE